MMLIRTTTVMAIRRNTSDLPSSRLRPIQRWFYKRSSCSPSTLPPWTRRSRPRHAERALVFAEQRACRTSLKRPGSRPGVEQTFGRSVPPILTVRVSDFERLGTAVEEWTCAAAR